MASSSHEDERKRQTRNGLGAALVWMGGLVLLILIGSTLYRNQLIEPANDLPVIVVEG